MKIATAPLAYIPAYIRKPAEPAPVQRIATPAGAAFHYVPGLGSTVQFPARRAGQLDRKKIAEAVLRFLSSRVAEHFGSKAVVANDAIWFCFDLKTLHDKAKETGGNQPENLGAAMNLAGDFCGLLGEIPRLEGAAGAGTGFYFMAQLGGKAYQGAGSFNLDNLMKFLPLKPEEKADGELIDMVNSVVEELQKA